MLAILLCKYVVLTALYLCNVINIVAAWGFRLLVLISLPQVISPYSHSDLTISCPCAVMPNGSSTRSWKVLDGKEEQDFGAQLSARRSLLLSVCSVCGENSESVDRVNNMLSFLLSKFRLPGTVHSVHKDSALPN